MGTETKITTSRNSELGIQYNPNVEFNCCCMNNGKCSLHSLHKSANCLATYSQQTSLPTTVPFIPILVDENSVIQGAKEVIKAIRPSWDLNHVQFKKFTDGITNKLVGCFYNPPNEQDSTSVLKGIRSTIFKDIESHRSNVSSSVGNVNRDYDSGYLRDDGGDGQNEAAISKLNPANKEERTQNVVLVRVYGSKTDLLIDRKQETRNIILLHSYGFAPSLYATFKNGLVYNFVPGVTLNPESVLRSEIWPLVAKRLADMHRIVKPNWGRGCISKQVPMLWRKAQSFFDLVPVKFSDSNKHERIESTFLPITRMRQEFADLYKHLEALGSPIVFAHNDLLLGNIIYTESSKTVTFIDYEYADFNYQAFDIGNHFAEFAGVDIVDYTYYPTRDFQLKWLTVYLQTYLQRSQISDGELEALYVQVNKFALAAHFFWTIWCLIQAEHSTLDFDYVEYAFIRYNEYLAKKEAFLALDANYPKCKI